MASRMSSMRSFHSGDGKYGLLQDSATELSLQHGRFHQVHGTVQDALKEVFQTDELKQATGSAEFHEEVDVALRTSFVPRHRAEDRERLHPELLKVFLVG